MKPNFLTHRRFYVDHAIDRLVRRRRIVGDRRRDLIWQWWLNGSPWSLGILGAVILVLYGIVPTYQLAYFGRMYAAYGGWFIVLSLLWGWQVDGIAPDIMNRSIVSLVSYQP